jgi:hypothetical protein
MSYRRVTEIPAESELISKTTEYISEGCVIGWGATASFGRTVAIEKYRTREGDTVVIEKHVISRITEADAWESLKSAGY